jgi:hypothetical protein
VTKRRCVYCGGQAITRDHVPPRCLLERPYPPNLPTVPSCSSCNAGFSLDEQYFVVLLTQVGVAPTLFRKQGPEGSITRALQKAPALKRRIFNSLASDEETGAILIRPELRRVHRVIQKIGLGLFVLRYNRVPRPGELARDVEVRSCILLFASCCVACAKSWLVLSE